MKKIIPVLGALLFLFPTVSSAAALTNDQANSLISVVQSSPGTAPSAFVPLITAFSSITIVQAESLINVVQQSPSTPAGAFVNLLVSFTVDPVIVQAPTVVQTPPILGMTQPTPQPTPTPQPAPTPQPVPTPVIVLPPQGVTEQVGYNIEYEQRVVRDSAAEADAKCANGNIDPTCTYLYAQANDFQNILNLVQSQWSTHRTAQCDLALSKVYNNMEITTASYYINLMNLVKSPHTMAYAQGMQAQYLDSYQTRMNQYLLQAQQVSSTCFGLPS